MIPTVKKTIRAGSGVAVKFLVTLQPFFNPDSIFFFYLVGLIIGAVYWASVVEIDEVIRANGKIVPATKAKTVQSEFQGSIEEILIDDGEKVKKNQVLLKLVDIEFETQQKINDEQYYAAYSKL